MADRNRPTGRETRVGVSAVELRAEGEGGERRIEGYAAVFGARSEDLGGFVEVLSAGAFKNVLATDPDVRALINHDPSLIVGRTKAGTLSLSEDAHGLRVVIKPADTSYGRDLMTSIERGDVSQMSFAFTVAENGQVWAKDGDMWLRTIAEVGSLYDVSVVTYPAYPDTEAALRSLTAAQSAVTRGAVCDPALLHRTLDARTRLNALKGGTR
jgi:HK97 family phage prohead protease